MTELARIPVLWWIAGFISLFVLVILVVVLINKSVRAQAWKKADNEYSDLGANTVNRIRYLEEKNETLVREIEGLRSQAKELLLYMDDRERKLEASRLELGVSLERARIAEQAVETFKQQIETLMTEGGLQRSSRSTGEKENVGTSQRQDNRSPGYWTDVTRHPPSGVSGGVHKHQKKGPDRR